MFYYVQDSKFETLQKHNPYKQTTHQRFSMRDPRTDRNGHLNTLCHQMVVVQAQNTLFWAFRTLLWYSVNLAEKRC